MALIRSLPLSLRLPLIHSSIGALARLKLNPKGFPLDDVKPGSIVISGFYNQMTGIGRAARQTLASFWRQSYPVIDHELKLSAAKSLSGKLVLPGKDGVWLIHANAPETSLALMAHAPSSWQNRYRIGYWAWETPLIPSSWVDVARLLHEIWVPSTYVLNAATKGFLFNEAPELVQKLRLMPHLVPNSRPGRIDRQSLGLSDKRCEVLCLFDMKSSMARKNPWGSLKAWTKAFPVPTDAARLTLKVCVDGEDQASIAALLGFTQNRPDIHVVTETLDDQEIHDFIATFDVLISLHRSEGFALSIAEAMEAGVAVIATDYSGNKDYMTARNSIPVPYHLVSIQDQKGQYSLQNGRTDQVWAEPDVDFAAKALVRLVSDPKLRKTLGRNAKSDLQAMRHVWPREALEALPFNDFVSEPSLV